MLICSIDNSFRFLKMSICQPHLVTLHNPVQDSRYFFQIHILHKVRVRKSLLNRNNFGERDFTKPVPNSVIFILDDWLVVAIDEYQMCRLEVRCLSLMLSPSRKTVTA